GGGQARCGAERDIVPFFSRRIGLSDAGQPLPIRGGARLTGKATGLDVGLLYMRVGGAEEGPSDDWVVGRVRRDVLANSQVGAFLFQRGADEGSGNRVTGADG